MKKFALIASLLATTSLAGCEPSAGTTRVADKDLDGGGVYVAYNLGCNDGCDQINKGDLIQSIDAKPVKVAADLSALTDGKPHKVEFVQGSTKQRMSVNITAEPNDSMPPLKDMLPFLLAGAEQLKKAPAWARRRMFAHASPSVMLVSSEGGILDGRQLHGKARFIVYWDHSTREDEAAAVDFMQVLQVAQGDLAKKNIDVLFTHLKFPAGRKAQMNDSDLRDWEKRNGHKDKSGKRSPKLPTYRFPNETEFNAARELGMENAFTVVENLGSSPTIVLLDANGIVRWHSEGVQDPATIGSDIPDPEQATIIAAVDFALKEL